MNTATVTATNPSSCEFTAYVQKEASADGNHHCCATDEGPANVEAWTHEKQIISINLEALRKHFAEDVRL